MKINRILSTKHGQVITIQPHESVKDAVDLLGKHNIGALVVVDKSKKLVGIISERDIIHLIAAGGDFLGRSVAEVMTREVITGLPQDDIASVMNTMTEKRFRHLPVVEEGKLIGIVSIGDIIKTQRDHYRGEIDTLETQIMAGED